MHRLVEYAISGRELSGTEAEEIMEELLGGRMETPEIVQLLSALNARPFVRRKLAGFARAMRRHATRVFAEGEILPERMVDTCGTGGDDSGTFNISTAAAIVAAAAGARVAKHGNRAAARNAGARMCWKRWVCESSCRSKRLEGYSRDWHWILFAQAAHTAARFAMPARKQLGVRTVFNLLGPLTNPAKAQSKCWAFSRRTWWKWWRRPWRSWERNMPLWCTGPEAGRNLDCWADDCGGSSRRQDPEVPGHASEFGVESASLSRFAWFVAENAATIRRIFAGSLRK